MCVDTDAVDSEGKHMGVCIMMDYADVVSEYSASSPQANLVREVYAAAMLDADRCVADPRCHWGPAEDPVCTAMLSNPSTVAKASKSARVLMPLK